MKTTPAKSGPPSVGSMVPLLMVYDMRRAVAFYCDVLGFEIEAQWEIEGHLYWAQLKCGDTRLMFNAEYEDDKRRPEHDRPHGKDITFFFYPKDLAALRETILSRGGRAGKLQETPYRHRQFHLKDPDGYTICFSQEIRDERRI